MSKIFVTYIESNTDLDAIQQRFKSAFPKPVDDLSNINSKAYISKSLSIKNVVKRFYKEFIKSIKLIGDNPTDFFKFDNNSSMRYKLPVQFSKVTISIGFDANNDIIIFIIGHSSSFQYKQIFKIQDSDNDTIIKIDKSIEESILGIVSTKKSPKGYTPIEPSNDWDRDRGLFVIAQLKNVPLIKVKDGKRQRSLI